MTSIEHIDAATAEAALRTAAFTTSSDEDDGDRAIRESGRGLGSIHSFAQSSSMAIGADVALDEVIAGLATADEIAWIDHPFNHDLAVRHGTRLRFYQVKRPERTPDG